MSETMSVLDLIVAEVSRTCVFRLEECDLLNGTTPAMLVSLWGRRIDAMRGAGERPEAAHRNRLFAYSFPNDRGITFVWMDLDQPPHGAWRGRLAWNSLVDRESWREFNPAEETASSR